MGKPLAGQLGQPQMSGGFGGQQSPMLQKPMQPMEPQMPQQNLGGFGGGMGAFQDLMRQQQQASQMPQQPAYGGFGNGMGINIAQPPQQSGGLFGALSPQQNPGGFGNQQQLQLQQALQSFRGQQQPQQAPQMPMIGPGGSSRDFYDRQVSPEQRARNEASMADGSYAAYYQQATGQPLPQQPMQQMPPSQPPTLGQATQPQMPRTQPMPPSQPMNQPLGSMQDRTNQLVARGLADFKPQVPQQVRPEPPRMQAMRGIQQLASRQRGYNR